MTWILIITSFTVGIWGIMSNLGDEKKQVDENKKQIYSMLKQDDTNKITYIAIDLYNAISLSENNRSLSVIDSIDVSDFLNKHAPYKYKQRIINLSDIISSEVVVDNETVTSTSRGSQIGGAVVGGVLLGGVGAIVGGLSGKTKSTEEVHKIDIKLTIDDLSNPICRINFLRPVESTRRGKWNGHKKDSEEYKTAILEVEKWQGMFDIILSKKNE